MTEQGLFEFYQNNFKPMYADLVAVTGEKSLVIDAQIESAMSHLAVSKTALDGSGQANIDDAYNHLVRACLDAAKLFWLNRFAIVRTIVADDYVAWWCLNIPHGQFVQLRLEAEEAIRAARRADAAGAGHAADQIYSLYVIAIQRYQGIIAALDTEKMDQIKRFRLWHMIKSQSVGFVVGVIASIVAAIIYAKVT